MSTIDTHGVRMEFGKHKGELITRVPLQYIRWLCNTPTMQSDLARAELARRGGKMPEVEISGHALDNASLRVWGTWKETRGHQEGLYSWLCRMTLEAIERGHPLEGGSFRYKGMKSSQCSRPS